MISFLGLVLWFSASFGVQGYGEIYNEETYIHPPVYSEIEIHAESDTIDIYGIYQNEMEINNLFDYRPMQDYFTVGISLTFGHISFSVEHMCQHPVDNMFQPITGEYDGYNKLWITIDSRREL